MSKDQLSDRITETLEQLKVYSERTGDLLHITMTRLRRTRGSRAAAAGHGLLMIAQELDHSSITSARIYIQARPDIVEHIDSATAQVLAPLAQAFAGRIIADESDAIRGSDPSSRINDPRFDGTQGFLRVF
jgi:hypothetical protein